MSTDKGSHRTVGAFVVLASGSPRLHRCRTMAMGRSRPLVTTGAWRLTRGLVVGVTAVGLALTGHWAASGGGLPPLLLTLGLATLVGVLAVAASARRWTGPRLLVVLLAAQWLFHTVFGSATPAGHIQHTAAHTTAPTADHVSTMSWSMVAAHVAAALLTAALLRRGERWVGCLVDALALRVVRLQVQLPSHASLVRRVVHSVTIPVQRLDEAAWSLRGPPR